MPAEYRDIDGEPFVHFTGAAAAGVTCRSCHLCEGGDHHWMPAAADNGDMVMVCRHCPTWRDVADDEEF